VTGTPDIRRALHRRARAVGQARDRRAAAIAHRDAVIRGARAAGIGTTALAKRARVSLSMIYHILDRPGPAVTATEDEVSAAADEVDRTERAYAARISERDTAVLAAAAAAVPVEEIAAVVGLTAASVKAVIGYGAPRPPAPRPRGDRGRTDWAARREAVDRYRDRRRELAIAGDRVPAAHGTYGYALGCRCEICHEAFSTIMRASVLRRRLAGFEPDRTPELLALVRDGATLRQACDLVGWSVSAVSGRMRWDEPWGRELDDALMAGRNPAWEHGAVYDYARGCRCQDCRTAAAAQRQHRSAAKG
jgi:DNA-directed RNA polymerase specialized sigma24 family protein